RGLKPAQDGEVVRVAEARGSAAGSARIAAWNDVGSRAAAEQCGSVGLAIGEDQRKTALKNRDTVESPTAYKSVRRGADVGPIPSALADGKIHHVADHQALRYVLRGKGALSGRVIVVLDAADAGFKPRCQRIGIADEFRISVGDLQGAGIRETLVHCELQRVIDAVIRALARKLHAGVLRERPQELADGGVGACERECLAVYEKGIGRGLHQCHVGAWVRKQWIYLRRGLRQQSVGNLVDLLRVLIEMSSLRTHVGYGQEEALR